MISRIRNLFVLLLIAGALHVVAAAPPMGKLKTRDNKPILINGHKAVSGTTLLSGSEIQCPDKVGATIDLGYLGRLDIAPNTDLTLTFHSASVSVQLRSGYVVLTTNKGICGSVNTTDGQVFKTDCSKTSSVIAKTRGAIGPETAASVGAQGGGINGAAAVGLAGAGAAVASGAAAKSGGRGSNLSTDNPRIP